MLEVLAFIAIAAITIGSIADVIQNRAGSRPETPVEDELDIDVQLEGEVYPYDENDALYDDGWEDGEADAIAGEEPIFTTGDTADEFEAGYVAGYRSVNQRFSTLN